MSEPRKIQFIVPGIPAPGGSKRPFINKYTGRVSITEDCKRSKPWRAVVALCAQEYCRDPFTGPVAVEVTFIMPRPKGHFRTGKNAGLVKFGAPFYPVTKPDCTKLWRSTEDALKGICWADDSQVVEQTVRKVYGQPGAHIHIRGIE